MSRADKIERRLNAHFTPRDEDVRDALAVVRAAGPLVAACEELFGGDEMDAEPDDGSVFVTAGPLTFGVIRAARDALAAFEAGGKERE